MSDKNNIKEGLVDTAAKILGGTLRAAKSKLAPASKMQVTTPAGKTYNMPRGATSTSVVPSAAEKTGSGLKPVGLGTAAAASTAVGAGTAAVQKTNEPSKTAEEPKSAEANKSTEKPVELPKIDVPAASSKPQTFGQAFAAARKAASEKGAKSSGQFEWQGKKYQTNIRGTGTTKKPEEKYVAQPKQTKVDVDSSKASETPKAPEAPKAAASELTPASATSSSFSPTTMTAPQKFSKETPVNPSTEKFTKPETESGGKRKKMSEETNPLVSAFLKLQETKAGNVFEAAKKLAHKDYDKDGKVESPKDEVWGSRFRAAKKAGKMEEGMLDSDDPSVQGSGDVTSTPAKKVSTKPTAPKSDSSVQRSGEVTSGGKPVSVREDQIEEAYKRKVTVQSGRVPLMLKKQVNPLSGAEREKYNEYEKNRSASKKAELDKPDTRSPERKAMWAKVLGTEEVQFSESELAHLEAVAPNRPEVAVGADSVSDKMSQNDVTGTSTESGKKIKEESDRDPRKHIQVEAGRAAAGNVVDFEHNDGSKSKITPAMGRRITAHLQSLKPSDRQAAVNKMHDSAEGLKV